MFSFWVCSSGASYFEVVYSIWFPINSDVFKKFSTYTWTLQPFSLSLSLLCVCVLVVSTNSSIESPIQWNVSASRNEKRGDQYILQAKEVK